MEKHFYTIYKSPLSELILTSDGDALTGLYFPHHRKLGNALKGIKDEKPFKEVIKQLDEYFAGKRKDFDLKINFIGTPFQKKVWNNLRKIKGKTINYAELAEMSGTPKAYRAAGNANGKNPISIIVPCHRVIASDGKLGGYTGGLDIKEWLLKHEGISYRK